MINTKLLHSLIPVFPQSEPEGKELAKLTLCKNQALNFQLAFHLDDAENCCEDFFIRIKTELPISMYYINNVPVIHTSSVPNATPIGMYPDILLPKKVNPKICDAAYPWESYICEDDEDVLLRAYNDSWQAVWFCINENCKNIKSGTYSVVMELYDTQNKLIQTREICAEVLQSSLPKQKLIYTNWFHYDCIAELYNEKVFSDRYFKIMADYVKKAAQNGMNMILMPAFTPPLDTGVGSERMTVQLVKITKTESGYEFDFSLMKRFVDICRKCGITHFEHCHFFTQWGAENAPKIMVYENGKEKKMFHWKTKATGKAYVTFLREYIKALKVFLKEEKLERNILFHISDEPDEKMLENYAKARNSIIDLLEGYMVGDAMSHVEYYEKGYCDMPISTTVDIHDFIGKCKNLWAYYTGGCIGDQRSNRVMGMTRERNRILGIQLYYYNIKGFLHWAYNNYYGKQSKYFFNPCLNPNGGFAMPGTSYMVYPAFNGSCYQSVRQKNFAEGIGDIQLLTLLEKKKGRKVCEDLIIKYFGVPHFDRTIDNAQCYIDFIDEVYALIK